MVVCLVYALFDVLYSSFLYSSISWLSGRVITSEQLRVITYNKLISSRGVC